MESQDERAPEDDQHLADEAPAVGVELVPSDDLMPADDLSVGVGAPAETEE